MNQLPVLAALSIVLAGCQSIEAPRVDMLGASLPSAQVPTAQALPMQTVPAAYPAPQPAGTQGAIFQAASHRPLFEDRRARLVGDTLTIQIEEQVSASQQSSSKVGRGGGLSAGVTALPFASPRLLGRLAAEAKSNVTGNGDGQTGSTNAFSGVITVLVQQVLPNGNLVVSGEKQIGVNQNVDVMRFSGIVNPATIRGGNTVSSTQVAEARLEQRGRGDIGRVQGLGLLTRFFLSVAPV